MNKKQIVKKLLTGRTRTPKASATAFAPANIALVKYWGKRNAELNIPATSSLSVSLDQLGSEVTISLGGKKDVITLNGKPLADDSSFTRRTHEFLSLFRPSSRTHFLVEARNTIPTAAGFASSASGFAAMVLALNDLFGWKLSRRNLSILARMGSGSASRSLFEGFVEWSAGCRRDGLDSYAKRLPIEWPDFRIGLLVISDREKSMGSRPAMNITVETSPLYKAWPATVAQDLKAVKTALRKRDFRQLGITAEGNALAMHATMMSARPSIVYWHPESVSVMHKIWRLRVEGLNLYFTMDAGPNLRLLFLSKDENLIRKHFPGLLVVAPFK